MRYKTDIDKKYMNLLLDMFESVSLCKSKDCFNKRSSVTSKGGRPYQFSPSEIENAMIAYFRECVQKKQPFMVTGLCLYLGLSRRGLLKLEKSSKKEFVPVIKKGKELIESYLEMQCNLNPNPSFSIFVLKNMGWADKSIINKEISVKFSEDEISESQERIKNFSE